MVLDIHPHMNLASNKSTTVEQSQSHLWGSYYDIVILLILSRNIFIQFICCYLFLTFSDIFQHFPTISDIFRQYPTFSDCRKMSENVGVAHGGTFFDHSEWTNKVKYQTLNFLIILFIYLYLTKSSLIPGLDFSRA